MSARPSQADTNLNLRAVVIDDRKDHAEAAAEVLRRIGCACRIATSGKEGLEIIREGDVDLVLTDLVMHDVNGLDIVEETKRYWPEVEVIVFTAHSSVDTAVEAMEKGALYYIEKPADIKVLRAQVKKAAERQRVARERAQLKRQIDKHFGFEGIIGQSQGIRRVLDVLRQISPTNATVLIHGESGAGKELVARAIHNNSPRRAHEFVGLNCAALSDTILESELFGHEKGAFTGADQQRQGRFEYADHGTLFLDEVGDMPIATQIKLLRVIEQREITRVGSNEPIKVDVRLIAATHRNLEDLVRAKTLREDLYFRLNVVRLHLPPLRERLDDIPLLADAFLQEFNQEYGKSVTISAEALRLLYQYAWPGNVRELKNCIQNLVLTARSGEVGVGQIPPHMAVSPAPSEGADDAWSGLPLDDVEKIHIKRTLEMTEGNREEAARLLKIGERTLYRKLDKYGLK